MTLRARAGLLGVLTGGALALAAALFPAAASAQSVTYTIAPSQDAWMRSNQAGQVQGATPLRVEPDKSQTLVQFNISSVPAGHYVVSATLRMWVTTASSGLTVRAHRANTAWAEGTVTWSSMALNHDAAIVGSATPATAGQYMDIDVTSLVRDWRAGTTNHGIMLTAPSGSAATSVSLASKETVTAGEQPPRLVVVANGYPSYSISKISQVISDPANDTTQPKRMPGAVIEYSTTVSSTNSNSSDSNSVALVEAVPTQATLYVGDLGGAGSGPVSFTNGSPVSGLTYTRATDLSFSNNGGSTFGYTPLPDGDGYDSTVTHLRIAPKGIFVGNTGGGNPTFTVAFRAKNK
ncbi:MAG TPA: DNRLRE domain-containing protein [Caulobacteraceae bacterium]